MAEIIPQILPERKLRASKCNRCGEINYPARLVCPKCGPNLTSEIVPVELSSQGTVVMWTQLKVTPTGFPSPLTICVVDIDGVKILGTARADSRIQGRCRVRIVEDASGKFPFQFAT